MVRRHARRQSAVAAVREKLANLGWRPLLVFGAALLLGGGGVRYGVLNLAVQLTALLMLCLSWHQAAQAKKTMPKGLVVLVVVTLALPLIHLIPLPPALWQALPGRQFALEARELVSAGDQWFAFSLDRGRTITAFASLLPALAILLLLPKTGSDKAGGVGQTLLRLLVAAALVNLLLGAFQIATGGASPLPYPIIDSSRGYGFFANHNSSGLFSVVALCALGGVKFSREGAVAPWVARLAIGLALIIATILTQSRSSTSLLLVPIVFYGARWLLANRQRFTRKSAFASVAALVIVIAGGFFVATQTRLAATAERFEDLEDARPTIWADGLVAAEQFFPTGSGMGTFDEVFQLNESLETLTYGFVRRAHNDYIEIAVEAGIVGAALVLAWFIWALLAWWRALRADRSVEAVAAGLALACIALQSLVDYPLRNQAFLCVAAVLVAVLARPSVQSRVR